MKYLEEDEELKQLKRQADLSIEAHKKIHLQIVEFIERDVYEVTPYLFELIKYNLNRIIELNKDIINLQKQIIELNKDA